MIHGRDVIIIAGIDWNYLWQSSQEIAVRLARAGNRVLYVENTGVRSPRLRDAARIGSRLARWLGGFVSGGLLRAEENVLVCTPLVLPPFGPGWRKWLNRRILIPRIRRRATRMGFRDAILWTFLPTDTATEIIRQVRSSASVVVYHSTADFSLLTPCAEEIHASERRLLGSCDLVFVTCGELLRRFTGLHRRVLVFGNGVDMESFPLEPVAPMAEGPSTRLHATERPVIGYVGGLHRFVDFDLLAAAIKAGHQWDWVFVGPLEGAASLLAKLPNARLVGPRPHHELAGHIRAFDVCIVPYLCNESTRTVLPSKLNEYLAMGKPVVSTPIEPVVEFSRRHGVVITAPNRPDEFLAAIDGALSQARVPDLVVRRRAVALLSDWKLLVHEMCSAIGEEQTKKPSLSANA